jgi:hypothetical protein
MRLFKGFFLKKDNIFEIKRVSFIKECAFRYYFIPLWGRGLCSGTSGETKTNAVRDVRSLAKSIDRNYRSF